MTTTSRCRGAEIRDAVPIGSYCSALSWRTTVPLGDDTVEVRLSPWWKVAIGVGGFAVLSGLGYLAYRYPVPSFGGGGGGGYGGGSNAFLEVGPGGSPRFAIRMNGRRRRRRR